MASLIHLNILRESSFILYLGLPTVLSTLSSISFLIFSISSISPLLFIHKVLIVKSLLNRSFFKSFIYFIFTGLRLFSYFISLRKVVTSNLTPLWTTTTLPYCISDITTFSNISNISFGVAEVQISISVVFLFNRVSLT